MIYTVAGTIRFPFSRLLLTINHQKEMGEIQEEIYMQYGSFRPPFKLNHIEYKRPIFSYEEHLRWIKDSRIIISEAGEDIVLLCLMMGKIPIVLPRRQIYGEQVDDHQVEFAQKLEEGKKVIVVQDEEQLYKAIREYEERMESCLPSSEGFLAATQSTKLHDELKGLLGQKVSKSLIPIDLAG